jgi:hypothetical protein
VDRAWFSLLALQEMCCICRSEYCHLLGAMIRLPYFLMANGSRRFASLSARDDGLHMDAGDLRVGKTLWSDGVGVDSGRLDGWTPCIGPRPPSVWSSAHLDGYQGSGHDSGKFPDMTGDDPSP